VSGILSFLKKERTKLYSICTSLTSPLSLVALLSFLLLHTIWLKDVGPIQGIAKAESYCNLIDKY
jgi:hypothetical protein